MDTLRAFVLQLATAGIVTAIADTLAPKTGSGKLIKLFTALFFMVSIMAPLLGFTGSESAFSVQNEEVESQRAEEDIALVLEDQIKQGLAKKAEEELQKQQIETEVKSVEILRDTDGNILVSGIVLCKDTEDRKAESILRELFGNTVEVVYEKSMENAPGT